MGAQGAVAEQSNKYPETVAAIFGFKEGASIMNCPFLPESMNTVVGKFPTQRFPGRGASVPANVIGKRNSWTLGPGKIWSLSIPRGVPGVNTFAEIFWITRRFPAGTIGNSGSGCAVVL